MSTLISPNRGPNPTRPVGPSRAQGLPCGRIIERTTTVTREYVIETASRARSAPPSPRWTDDELLRHPFDSGQASTDSAGAAGSAGTAGPTDGSVRAPGGSVGAVDSTGAVVTLGTIDRLIIRLGAWLVGVGRRRAMHPGPSPEDIAARLDEAKDRDLRRFAGVPHSR